jgi:hypothetical protein
MKTHCIHLTGTLSLLLFAPLLRAQTAPVPQTMGTDSGVQLAVPDIAARTFIPDPLEVPSFTPPVPVPRKVLAPVRVEASVSVLSKNSRTLSIRRGEPSTKPDLPPPPPPQSPQAEPAKPTPEQIARRIWGHRHNLNLGAIIYDHQVSVINWTDQESLVQYEAVCGFDIGLLAGVGRFVHKGENYSFFLAHSHISMVAVRRFAGFSRFQVPTVPEGGILITRGDQADPAATAHLAVLRDIIATENPRLLAYQTARESYFAASSAWHAAHPPVPHDETFVLRPHRGSRYLTNGGGGQ